VIYRTRGGILSRGKERWGSVFVESSFEGVLEGSRRAKRPVEDLRRQWPR
jgi:hypothetical protein